MFATFRRHQKWIWIAAVIVVIPSFVLFFSPDTTSSGPSGGGTGNNSPYTIAGKAVTIDGDPVTLGQFRDAHKETRLALFIRSGGREWPENNDRLNNEAIYRVFLIHKMKEMNVAVSKTAAATMARNRLGNYPYAAFKTDILSPNGLTGADFERYIHNETAILQMINAAALNSKLITPDEAEFIYRQENEEVSTAAAVFFQTNYLDQVTITDALISQHYTNSRPLYRIPSRVQTRYVEFAASNFYTQAETRMSEVTNLSERVDSFYFERGPSNFNDTNDVELTADAAKVQIREMMRHDLALNLAHQKANEFGGQLMENPNANNTNTFVVLAKQNNYEIKVSPPFDSLEGLEGSGLPDEFAQIGANLRPVPNPTVFQPIRGTNAIYVISWRNTVPFRMQSFEEVKDQVVEDYKKKEANKLAISAGTNFYTFLTNGLAAGKKFKDMAKEKNVAVIDIPPFSPTTQTLTNLDERLNLSQIRRLAFNDLEVGQVSRFTRTFNGAFVLHMNERLEFDDAKVKAELPETISRLQSIKQSEAFNQWFGKQAQQSLVVPQPPAPAPTPGAPGFGFPSPGSPGR